MLYASVIQDHNTTLTYQSYRIAELASTRFEVQNNTDRINEIIVNRKTDNTIVQKYNDTLIDLGNRITSIELDKNTIQDNSDAITEVWMNEKERNVTATEHEKIIAEIETGLSLVQNTTNMITKLHNKSINDLSDRLTALEPYCSIDITTVPVLINSSWIDRQTTL